MAIATLIVQVRIRRIPQVPHDRIFSFCLITTPVLVLLGGNLYPDLGGDCPRNFVLVSTQALAANVTGITGSLSGQWIQEARPEFDIEQPAKFFNHFFQ
jgi:hypothetical protein